MSRAVNEWIGKTDDTAMPARAKDRVLRAAGDCCVRCERKVGGKLRAEFDHIVPLILGGANRESNIQLLCSECHVAKTKLDVKLKAKVARVRKKHLGFLAERGPTIQSAGFRKAKPQRSASRPLKKRTASVLTSAIGSTHHSVHGDAS
jgi:5-methylcytosine-specific restriction protein A